MNLEKQNILVTGGSRGIGKSIVKVLAEHGANVGFTFLSNQEKAESLASEIKEKGNQAIAYHSDASDFESAQKLVTQFLKDFGSLDGLVNNAGITRDNLLIRMSESDFDKVIATNLKSVFNLSKAAYRPLMKQKKGSVVNISSVVGVKGNAGQANYAASKAGIHGFTKSLALELAGRSVRVNSIAPGFIQTDMTDAINSEQWLKYIPMKRAGKAEEVAQLTAFLLSDYSQYITGQVIEINGGLHT